MKKLLNFTFILILLVSTMSYAQKKPGWAIATVDAGGALAAGLGVLQVTGGVAATNPWGWAAVGVGSVIGGAASSVGFAYSKSTNNSTSDNLKNDLNMVGVKHNEIVRDYFEYIKDDNISMESYLNYIEVKYPKVYIDVKEVININYLNQQKEEIENLNEDEDFINWTINKLPKDVNKDDFKEFFVEYTKITSKEEALNFIMNYENKLIESDLSRESIELMKYYFATLRNSTVLW